MTAARRRAAVLRLVPLTFVREHIESLEARGIVGVYLVYDDPDRARRDAGGNEDDVFEWVEAPD